MTGGTLKSSSSVKILATIAATGARAGHTTTSQQTTSYGTGSAQANLIVRRSRTLSVGQSETIDLLAGATLLDLFDGLTPFGKIKYIEIAITSGGDAGGLRIGGAASSAWGGFFEDPADKFTIFPTGPSFRGGSDAGVALSATAKNLKIENLGAVSVTYDIVVAGTAVATAGEWMGGLGITYS